MKSLKITKQSNGWKVEIDSDNSAFVFTELRQLMRFVSDTLAKDMISRRFPRQMSPEVDTIEQPNFSTQDIAGQEIDVTYKKTTDDL